MSVGHSPKLCTSNYHQGWPIFCLSLSQQYLPFICILLYLWGYTVTDIKINAQRPCSCWADVANCFENGSSCLWHGLHTYQECGTVYTGPSGRKQSWFETCNIDVFPGSREALALQKPKFWNIQPFPMSCFISSQTCYKHTRCRSVQHMSTLDATLFVITHYCVLFICNKTRTPNIKLVTYEFLITGLFASEIWLGVGPMNFLIKCRPLV